MSLTVRTDLFYYIKQNKGKFSSKVLYRAPKTNVLGGNPLKIGVKTIGFLF